MPQRPTGDEPLRAFLAVYADAAANEGMAAFLADLRRTDAPVRWEKAAQLHITMRFLGDVARADLLHLARDLAGRTGGIAPFAGSIDSVGAFPNLRRPRIVWLGFDAPPPAFASLHAAVRDACAAAGLPPEDKPFTPHITVGRVREQARPGDLEKALGACTFHSVPARFDALRIMTSRLTPQGAIHTELARIDFTPGENRGETTIILEE
jgi:RNA 2',3'-cyclic 3'-phosphodiesterase